jgi:hypothetical protein
MNGKEKKESFLKTWGRIISIVKGYSKTKVTDKRFEDLIFKIDDELDKSVIKKVF